MVKLTAISGLGAKGPACFLLETGQARLMLDLGYGPAPGQWPDLAGTGAVDALVLSHGHRDHAGALKLAPQVANPPLHATAAVLARLGREAQGTALPLRGQAEICGIPVRTGRNGHAPGGVWLHFDIAGGILYTGDYGVESPIYAYDPPPPAQAVVLDASYGDYAAPLSDSIAALGPSFDSGSALLPVPADGRGPEIAFHLAEARGVLPCLGDDLRASLKRMASDERDSLRPGVADVLARVAREAPPISGPRGVLLAGRADSSEGQAGDLSARWQSEATPEIIYTGYFAPGSPAQRQIDAGRARYVRWNVHPRLADNVALARSVGARLILPAFGDGRHLDAWQRAFAPARVTLDRQVLL